MRNRHGPDADTRSGWVRNARRGCTSAIRFSTLTRRNFTSITRALHSNMASHIHSESDLDAALAALTAAEPRFSALVASAGRPPLRRRPGGFPGLAATVVSQQLSTASAGAIWGRLAAAFDPFEPAAIIKARASKLARIGLSRPKIKALKEIARAVKSGGLALAKLGELAAEDA